MDLVLLPINNTQVMKLQMCRICLVENVAMLPIAKTPLQEIFEKLMTMPLETNTIRPILVCYMCYARLRKCYHLRNTCLRSETMLVPMLKCNDHNQSTPSTPRAVPNSNFLTVTPLAKISTCDILNEGSKVGPAEEIQIKIEATLTEEIDIKKEPVDTSGDEEYVLIKTEKQDSDLMLGDPNNSTVDNLYRTHDKKLTEPNLEHSASQLKESTETLNTEEKCNINKVIVTEILDKIHNTIKCQEHNVTSSDVIKQTIVCSDATIKPNSRDFGTINNLETYTTSAEKPYQCEMCFKLFKQKSVLIRHCRQHNAKKPCDVKFNKQPDLVNHSISHTSQKPYKCEMCFKQFTLKGNLIDDFFITGEKPLKCDVCIKQFNQKTQHSSMHTGKIPPKCDICNKYFNHKSSLARHLRAHAGARPYKCDFCIKQFNQKNDLIIHLRVHSGDKPYKCNICFKQFTQKGNLRQHLLIHTGEKLYKCDVCMKQFYQKTHLLQHSKMHTGKIAFECDICNKHFNYKRNLVRHLSAHAGVKPYKCDICKKRFIYKSSLVQHLAIHTGEKPYTCDICNKEFIYKSSLNKHLRRHTKV